MRFLLLAISSLSLFSARAQCDGWQQHIECKLAIALDVGTHRFTGTETLTYQNNSPDTLRELYFHLYLNAFKPGSEMDVRSRTIADPDPRVGDRIAALQPDEVGDLQCSGMKQDGSTVLLEHLGTVMRATLARPIPPNAQTAIAFNFKGQVPVQIRRTGRDNAEGIAYSMTQWYPKVATYDRSGWHADPYVGREFYGEWGNYDVRITLDSAYTVAATGVLMNPEEIGHGYAARTKPGQRTDGKLTWHFSAPAVHDFAWSADPRYKHVTAQVPNGPLLRFIYQDIPELAGAWEQLPAHMVHAVEVLNKRFGTYPWPTFTFAQGGDGGMEYPMLTLINGERHLGSLVGTAVHELCHNWYYGVLASNELSYPWMDEGFSEYAGVEVIHELLPATKNVRDHSTALAAYKRFAASPDHQPMRIAADHFSTNRAYSSTAYSKGEFFLDQLGAVIGDSTLHRGLRRYFNACAFKHPDPVDFQLAVEKESGLQLDWYFDEWINTVRILDYAVDTVMPHPDGTHVVLRNNNLMLMPVDLAFKTMDGDTTVYNIPLSLMLGARSESLYDWTWVTLAPWQWTNPAYSCIVPIPLEDVKEVILDPFNRTGDLDLTNNRVKFVRDLYDPLGP